MAKNTIAIIGKPNVGKSTLFNRLIGKKISIIYDRPGITRDRLYEKFTWNGKEIRLIDTGGIEIENKPFQEQIRIQADIAINEADVIIFMIDGTSDITNDDLMIISKLKKTNKPIVIAANKLEKNMNEFDFSLYKLGIDKIFSISAQHGQGIGDLLDECLKFLIFDNKQVSNNFKLSIIGRPNAGKSSLLNKLANENRSIVSNIPGTTRDSVKSIITLNNEYFEIIDTAGITRKSKIEDNVEKYALMRALNSLEESNLSIIMLDSTKEISHFDSTIIGEALENNKPIIIAINKWDLIEKDSKTMQNYEKNIRNKFHFVPWVPIVFISAKTNLRMQTLIETIIKVKNNLIRDIKPSILSSFIRETQIIQPAPPYNGGRLNIYLVKKIKAPIPTFIFFVNNKKYLHFSYQRHLENEIRKVLDFAGCPLKLIFKNKNGLE